MTRDRLRGLVGVCAGSVAIALVMSPIASADPPSWNGEYAITFIVGPKSGTSDPLSLEVRQLSRVSGCGGQSCVGEALVDVSVDGV